MKFIVDRRTWYRGQGVEKSHLLREDGQRCCIGFVAQQCGVPDEGLLNKASIYSTDHSGQFPTWMVVGINIQTAYITNDRLDLSDEEREAKLQAIFRENGDEIEFIN